MHYVEFAFKNFKGISNMTLSLDGAVTTLIGLNESGKTTILEAIFCFSYGAENLDVIDPSLASLRDPERWIPIAGRGNFNDHIEISATIRLSDDDQQKYKAYMVRNLGIRLTDLPRDIPITERYFFENSRYIKERTKRTWGFKVTGTKGGQRNPRQLTATSAEWQASVSYFKERLPRIWYFPNFLFELPERFPLEEGTGSDASAEADKSLFYRLTFEEILHQLGSGATLDTHIVARIKSQERADQRNLKSLLLDMSRDITKTVFDGWNRIFGSTPVGQEVEIAADTSEDGTTYLELKIKGPDGYSDLSERSLGFRWFFMFLLMTSYRGQARSGRGVVFLLDEPASNLHSTAQAELLKSFEHLAETCQLVYTTHSHHMINIRWLDSAFIVKNEGLGDFSLEQYLSTSTAKKTAISATKYRRFVAEHPTSTSYFQPVLDVLDYRPSDLEPVPNVVLVEGKSDFYLLKYATEIVGLQSSFKLIPGGGAGSLDPLIRLHIGWGKSFIILLDGDAEGAKQRRRYDTIFGPFVHSRCWLLPELCNDLSIHEVEDLLDPTACQAIMDAVYGKSGSRVSGKKALAHAVIELFARQEFLGLGSKSLERLNQLILSLDEALKSIPM